VRRWIAIGAVVLAWALPMQSVGCGQNAHYAATRSFAQGHPDVDRYANETCDLVKRDGHYYAAKGPAMDFWSAPWYLVLHALHAVPRNPNAALPYPAAMTGVPLRAIWQIGLWAVVLPGAALLLLVRRAADDVEPGTGVAVAVILGLGTLLFPFATLLFAHVPAALLGFASFLLLYERRNPLLAGVCAGLAVATDLPLVVVAAALLVYAWRRAPRFALGALVGAAPLFAFGIWAFGNPFRIAYSGAAIDPGAGGVEQAQVHGLFYTLTSPHPHIAVQMLLAQRGLLVLTPVIAAAGAGVVLLWRRGLRAEAALIVGLTLAELAWHAFRPSYELALGGWVPGPRFLVPLLPFLAFALAPALRRWPATVGALAAISIAAMTIATAAEPLLANDDTHHWIARIADGNFAATVLSLGGIGHGWLAILPFFAAVVVAVAAALPRFPITRRDLVVAIAAVGAWVIVEHGAPELLRVDDLVRQSWGALAALFLLVGAAWAVAGLRPEGLLLLPFAALAFDRHTKWALLLALAVVLLESARWLRSTGSTALRPSTTSSVKRRSSGP
jgi:phage shock protein PspC (stress-responsive transcriptional regulator)